MYPIVLEGVKATKTGTEKKNTLEVQEKKITIRSPDINML